MILAFLMDNIANPFSARSIVAALKQEGINTTVETVIAYIDYIKKRWSYIAHSVTILRARNFLPRTKSITPSIWDSETA